MASGGKRGSAGERVLEGRHVIGLFMLMLLFSGERELIRQFAGCALGSQKGEEQNSAGREQREKSENR